MGVLSLMGTCIQKEYPLKRTGRFCRPAADFRRVQGHRIGSILVRLKAIQHIQLHCIRCAAHYLLCYRRDSIIKVVFLIAILINNFFIRNFTFRKIEFSSGPDKVSSTVKHYVPKFKPKGFSTYLLLQVSYRETINMLC